MSHRTKKKPEPTTEPPTSDAAGEQERDLPAAVRPMTLREAATVLAGLRHLARLTNGGR